MTQELVERAEAVEPVAPADVGPQHAERAERPQQHRQATGRRHALRAAPRRHRGSEGPRSARARSGSTSPRSTTAATPPPQPQVHPRPAQVACDGGSQLGLVPRHRPYQVDFALARVTPDRALPLTLGRDRAYDAGTMPHLAVVDSARKLCARLAGLYALNVYLPLSAVDDRRRLRRRARRGATSRHAQPTRLPPIEWHETLRKSSIYLVETQKRNGNVRLSELGLLAQAAAACYTRLRDHRNRHVRRPHHHEPVDERTEGQRRLYARPSA